MEEQKLDNFNKILLATGQINYMASSLNGSNIQMKMFPKDLNNNYITDRTKETDKVLGEAVRRLGFIMEELANYINGIDCICPIDVRVSEVPFDIIIHGKDEVDNEYNSEN